MLNAEQDTHIEQNKGYLHLEGNEAKLVTDHDDTNILTLP